MKTTDPLLLFSTFLTAYSDLKWLASYPTYNDMVAVFGTDIVGSKSNYSTYMALVRQTTDDYSNATSEFLTDVRAMKPKLRRIEEGMR